jgi:hypothetical protein
MTQNKDIIGTEEWQVAHDPHIAHKERLEGTVVAIWLLMLVFFILVALGARSLFAGEDPVQKITAPCKCGGTFKATGYFVNNSRQDNPYVAVRWQHVCRQCSTTNWLDLPYPIIKPIWTGSTNGMPVMFFAWATNNVDAVTSMPRRATATVEAVR